MGFRITTWNVNGIRNPFSYEPWRGNRTFEAMFDTLEADIIIFQETKIQRKDLRDDMVLVPGWDCYFSLPRIKKGYSGVVIYTRNATCAPIRAEEGLTGILCPPNSSIPFRDLPEDQQIGGYPTIEQLSQLELDAPTLDSEGRCVILEFPAFVLFGLYCPANRDESRDSFRHNFLDLMDARVRNLIAMGKRVIVTGDLNISAREIDQAAAGEAVRKGTMTEEGFVSAQARRLFNQLLLDGMVVGERDDGREEPVLYDLCRSFYPDRKGMYTCWDQKLNTRPGNYGARIDYVLCSLDMQEWFSDSNIQEGLMGSDHCPVYATLKDAILLNDGLINIRDIMNPPGVFVNGERQQVYTTKMILPTSGRLIPEFDKRRSIKDMFSRKPAAPASNQSFGQSQSVRPVEAPVSTELSLNAEKMSAPSSTTIQSSTGAVRKRSDRADPAPSAKRSRYIPSQAQASPSGQKTLKGFFKPKDPISEKLNDSPKRGSGTSLAATEHSSAAPLGSPVTSPSKKVNHAQMADSINRHSSSVSIETSQASENVIDQIASKEDWSKLFTKKPAPKCEGHEEPCVRLTTKKPGINCGRSFWICPRPLGPSGNKEKGTQWRCSTFIWASDRNP